MFESFDLVKILAMIAALLIAIIGHEIMHGVSALAFGDTTAKDENRLSLNPVHHIDPMGTVFLPLMLLFAGAPFLFGWAKPVPINIHRVLQKGHLAMVVVSLAGIFYNLIVAFVAGYLIGFFEPNSFLFYLMLYLVLWNVVLAVFNLLPIPPLDGSNALAHIASFFGFHKIGKVYSKMGMWGMVILVVILMTDLKFIIFAPVDLLVRFFLS